MRYVSTRGAWTGDPAQPIDVRANASVPLLLTLHFELMVAALKSDVTRVGTMQFGDATGGAIVFDFVSGVPRIGNGYQPFRDWHDLGHQPVRAGVPDDRPCASPPRRRRARRRPCLPRLLRLHARRQRNHEGTSPRSSAFLLGGHQIEQ